MYKFTYKFKVGQFFSLNLCVKKNVFFFPQLILVGLFSCFLAICCCCYHRTPIILQRSTTLDILQCTVGRETNISRYPGAHLGTIPETHRTSRHYGIQGYKRAPYCHLIMLRNVRLSCE